MICRKEGKILNYRSGAVEDSSSLRCYAMFIFKRYRRFEKS